MPRQSFTFDSFKGGINQVDTVFNGHPECYDAVDLVPEGDGMRMMGGEATQVPAFDDFVTVSTNPGYGFFIMATDNTLSPTITGQPRNVFYVIGGNFSGATKIDIIDTTTVRYSDVTGGSVFELDSVTQGKVTYYYSEGQLRIGNADKSMTTTTAQWFGYIDRTHYYQSATDQTFNGWYVENAELAPPTIDRFYWSGYVLNDSGLGDGGTPGAEPQIEDVTSSVCTTAANHNLKAGDIITVATAGDTMDTSVTSVSAADVFTIAAAASATDASSGSIFYRPQTDYEWCVAFANTSDSGTLDTSIKTNYQCGLTYIYDDLQESPIAIFDDSIELGSYGFNSRKNFGILVYCHITNTSTYLSNQRITGLKVYLREWGSDDWMLAGYADLTSGGYWANLRNTDIHDDWVAGTITDLFRGCWLTFSNYDGGIKRYNDSWDMATTYYQETGYSRDATACKMSHWASAVIVNRIAYLGNVKFNDENYPDSIFKSRIGKYDMFDKERRVAAKIDDGEDIVKLESYNDRLFVFKTNTLYILNISQEIEFLESTHKNLGISYPYQSCESEYGIAWINDRGCFLNDGERIIDLLLDRNDQTRRKIDLTTWQSFLSTTPYIFYDPQGKRFIVGDDIDKDSDHEVYVYSIIEGGWTRGVNKINDANVVVNSNFVVDPSIAKATWLSYVSGDVPVHNVWDDAPDASSNISFQTLSHDFGDSSRKKHLYHVSGSYYATGTTATNANFQFTFDYNEQRTNAYNLGDSSMEKCTNSKWKQIEYTPYSGATGQSRNKYYYAIGISNTANSVPASFQFKELTMVGRIKGYQN